MVSNEKDDFLKNVLCGPSMTDCPETSRNLLETSGIMPDTSGNLPKTSVTGLYYKKPTANLPPRRLPEISGQLMDHTVFQPEEI